MKHKFLLSLFVIAALLIGAGPGLARPQAAQAAVLESTSPDVALADLLQADGRLSLPQGKSGSIDPSGWRMVSGLDEAPRFVSAAQGVPNDHWASGFSYNTGLSNGVSALAYDGSGNLYVGGWFPAVGDVVVNYIAKWDGATWSKLGNGFDAAVVTLAIDSSGSLYAGGGFRELCNNAACSSSTPGYNGIAKWNGAAWSKLGSGANGGIYSLAVGSAGNLYAGGKFTGICSDAACATVTTGYNNIAKWNGAAWSKLGNGFGAGYSTDVIALAVDSAGNLYAGGAFTKVCTNAACSTTTTGYNHIAKWDGATWEKVSNGFDDFVLALAIDNTGKLYAGGLFKGRCENAACSSATPLNYIAQWNGASWGLLGNGFNGNVGALTVDSAGALYAGGGFNAVCQNPDCASKTPGYNHIAKWNGTAWSKLGNGFDSDVSDLAIISPGNLYAGGYFTSACSNTNCSSKTPGYNYMAKWDGATWSQLGSGAPGNGISDPVYALAFDSAGNLYVGGTFGFTGNAEANYIAKWDGAAWSMLGYGLKGQVRALIVDNAGNLYAGGWFDSACDNAACNFATPGYHHIAKWDGTAWSMLGSGFDSNVYALAVDSSGNLYAGGEFTSLCDDADCGAITSGYNHVAKWNGTAWSMLGSGANGGIYSLAVDGSDNLYAGGNFTGTCDDADCSTTTGGYNHIAKWDGTAWNRLGYGFKAQVQALAVDASGALYAGGLFDEVCSDADCSTTTGGYGSIAKWDGTAWSRLGYGLKNSVSPLRDLRALVTDDAGNLYAGGVFTLVCQDATCSTSTPGYNRVARWDGAAWYKLGGGINSDVSALAYHDGALFVGGDFSKAGGKASSRIARWDATNIVQFSQTTYNAPYLPGMANITIQLDIPSAITASITLSTTGGTAVPGVDYTPVNTVVEFAPGETQQVVQIPILPYLMDGPSKTVGLLLSNPVECDLGTDTATLVLQGIQSLRQAFLSPVFIPAP